MSSSVIQTKSIESELSHLIANDIRNQTSMHDPKNQQNLVIDKIRQEWNTSGEWTLLDSDLLPQEFNGFVPPDIVARFHNGHPLAIAEVETSFTLFAHDSLTRWSRLGAIAPITFYLYVPKGYEMPCRYMLNQHGISATLGTYSFDEYFKPLVEPSVY